MKLGIDFGTCFSLPATTYLDQNVVLLPGGKYGIPSVFYYSKWDDVLIGEEAEAAGQGVEARNLKREIKLELKSSFTADGKTFSAKQIVGYILNNVKQNALAYSSERLGDTNIEGVVISVPAAFENNEKEIIKAAAQIPSSQGGPQFNVLGFIKEPVAAALSYFKTSLADKTRVLVYDLGGGTCDVAIVEANSTMKEKYKVIDSEMERIGGKDWDAKLESYIIQEVEKQSGKSIRNNPGYMEKVKRAAIQTKHAFSEKEVTGKYKERVRARVEIDGRTYAIPFERATFDKLTMDLFNKTLALTKRVLAENGGNSINKIVCVGGSSKMPQVQEGLKNAFPDKTIQVFEPEKAIAMGAAIYAQYCDGTDEFLSDIAAFSYGHDCYEHYDVNPNDYIVVNLIKKGQRLPFTQTHNFVLVDKSTRMNLSIIENSVVADRYAYVNGTSPYIMDVILDFGKEVPKGTKATLKLTLTTDGLLEATAFDKENHQLTVRKQLYY